jgi:hypothetical protein
VGEVVLKAVFGWWASDFPLLIYIANSELLQENLVFISLRILPVRPSSPLPYKMLFGSQMTLSGWTGLSESCVETPYQSGSTT